MLVLRPFGENDDIVAAPDFLAFRQLAAQIILPGVFRGVFRDEYPGGPGGDGAGQRQITAIAAHDFHDENPLMAECGAAQCVDGVHDPVQRRIRADGHVGVGHVVVDRTDHADNLELRIGLPLFGGDPALCFQLGREVAPIGAECVGSPQAAVAADDDQAVDPAADQVFRRFQFALERMKFLTARSPDHGSPEPDDAGHRIPLHFDNPVFDQPLIALINRIDVQFIGNAGADNGTDGGVHSGGISATGQHGNGAIFIDWHSEILLILETMNSYLMVMYSISAISQIIFRDKIKLLST